MRTVRTRQNVVERDEELDVKPRWKVGDYVQVYFGTYEGHHFWVKEIRYNHDYREFEYAYDFAGFRIWQMERQLSNG